MVKKQILTDYYINGHIIDIYIPCKYNRACKTYEKATLKKFRGRKAIGPLKWQPATNNGKVAFLLAI
jgi:hypothetical protein